MSNCYIEDTDLCTMLGNILDNAYEAAVQCEEEKRWMHLDISSMKGMSMLTVENSCIAEPIVDKYNGYMEYTYREGVFTVKIQI